VTNTKVAKMASGNT